MSWESKYECMLHDIQRLSFSIFLPEHTFTYTLRIYTTYIYLIIYYILFLRAAIYPCRTGTERFIRDDVQQFIREPI